MGVCTHPGQSGIKNKTAKAKLQKVERVATTFAFAYIIRISQSDPRAIRSGSTPKHGL
jgi:hypothetical protein